VLIELGVVEQRHKAVLEVLDGLTVTEVALRYGVTRQTVHRWLRRYQAAGLPGLTDLSSRPQLRQGLAGRCVVGVVEARQEDRSVGEGEVDVGRRDAVAVAVQSSLRVVDGDHLQGAARRGLGRLEPREVLAERHECGAHSGGTEKPPEPRSRSCAECSAPIRTKRVGRG
jgi:transposase-like protein